MFDDDIEDAVTAAFNDALTQADRPGELPTLVLVHSSPGHEETVIATVNELTGGDTPIVGAARGEDGADVAGGLVIYCAGCRLAVGDELDAVRQQLNEAFDGAPNVAAFTFGEQGCLLGGENHHDNLMISAAVFGTV